MSKQNKQKNNFTITKFKMYYINDKDKKEKQILKMNEKKFSGIVSKINRINNELFMMNLSISKLCELYNHVNYRIIVTNLNFDILYCNPIFIGTNTWKLEGFVLLYNNLKDMHNKLYQKNEFEEPFEKVHSKIINENIDVAEFSKVFYGDIKATFFDEQIIYKSKKMGYLFKIVLTDQNKVEIVIN
jgi:hypothetical protein